MDISKYNNVIRHVRGDTGVLSLEVLVNNQQVTPSDVVLSIKESMDDTEYLLQVRMNQNYEFVFNPSDTKDLKPGIYCYDIQVTMGEDIYTPVVSTFILDPDIT